MTKHESTLLMESLLHGKLPRSLAWSDVLELIKQVGSVELHGQEFAFAVGMRRDFFKKPHGHELNVEEVSLLRNFLRAAMQPVGEPTRISGRTVVVVDHHSAHVYRDEGGSEPVQENSDTPYDPHGFHRHLIHRKEAHYRGERVPEEDSFYEQIAEQLKAAKEVVLIGHGTGNSSAVGYLETFLQERHPEIATKVVAVDRVDLSALTPPEIEQLARQRFTGSL